MLHQNAHHIFVKAFNLRLFLVVAMFIPGRIKSTIMQVQIMVVMHAKPLCCGLYHFISSKKGRGKYSTNYTKNFYHRERLAANCNSYIQV